MSSHVSKREFDASTNGIGAHTFDVLKFHERIYDTFNTLIFFVIRWSHRTWCRGSVRIEMKMWTIRIILWYSFDFYLFFFLLFCFNLKENLGARIRTRRFAETHCEHNRWHTYILERWLAKWIDDGLYVQSTRFHQQPPASVTAFITERAQAFGWKTVNFWIGKVSYVMFVNAPALSAHLE